MEMQRYMMVMQNKKCQNQKAFNMVQEQEQLLLKDLCSRLPYGVFVQDRNGISKLTPTNTEFTDLFYSGICNIKPFLRPLSSMTEEEDKEWQLYKNNIACSCDKNLNERINELRDWFNKKSFDYRGLIEKGLALEASEDMYKQKRPTNEHNTCH